MPRSLPQFRRQINQYRMWMPTMPLTLVSARNATDTHPAWAIFRTWPKATKHEIKEYLTKIYNLPVMKVRTMNYEGKRKRLITAKIRFFWKYADYKKAVVTFDPQIMRNVGIGTRVDDLDQDDDDNLNDDDEGNQIQSGSKK